MFTPDWSEILDQQIHDALHAGRVRGVFSGTPDRYVESGLAHVFFYGDTVIKLYKTHQDKDHFIKGVLAPTQKRTAFMEHDYALNTHFSGGIYKNRYSVYLRDGVVEIMPYDGASIHVVFEMDRLNFVENLHEQLLAKSVTPEQLYAVGFATAELVATCAVTAPAGLNWYELALGRLKMAEQFVEWLPAVYGDVIKNSCCIEALHVHLEKHKSAYQLITGDALTVSLDNHDENVFWRDGTPAFIDLLPPMQSWWYGVPCVNLSNLMVNVEALMGDEAAANVKEGFVAYAGTQDVVEPHLSFTRAFAYVISIAHFGSVPGKHDVTERYLARVGEIKGWL